jgi:hypothetical protein
MLAGSVCRYTWLLRNPLIRRWNLSMALHSRLWGDPMSQLLDPGASVTIQ